MMMQRVRAREDEPKLRTKEECKGQMVQKVRVREHKSEGQKRSAVDRLGREFEMMIRLFSL